VAGEDSGAVVMTVFPAWRTTFILPSYMTVREVAATEPGIEA
jgi:hypothetical protein